MPKAFNRITPLASQPVEESERHYTEVHTGLAQRLLAGHERIVVYTQFLVARQYDLTGGWRQRPDAWRFVVMVSSDPPPDAAERPVATGSETRQALADDHIYCLRELRRTPVEEEVLVDRRAGQTTSAQYIFEYDRPLSAPAGEAADRFLGLARSLGELAGTAFGIRLVVANKVLGESKAVPITEPGQLLTDEMLPETPKVGYLQIAFDDVEWGDEFFARPEVRSVLQDRWFAVASGYHVVERCGFDKR